MKIGPQDPSAYADSNGTAGRAGNKAGGDTRAALIRASGVASALGATGEASTVRISSLATGALQTGNAPAEVDMDKVRQVQAALAQGSYRVNPESIADELIASAQALLKPKS